MFPTVPTFPFPAQSPWGWAGSRAGRAGAGDVLGMWLQGHRVPQFVLHLSSCGARGGLGFAWSRKGLCLLTDFLKESQIPSVPEDIIFHQHVGWTCQVRHQRGKFPFPSPVPFPIPQLNQTLSSAHWTFSQPRSQTCPAPCTGGSCSQKTQPSVQGCCSSWAWWDEVGSSHSCLSAAPQGWWLLEPRSLPVRNSSTLD